MANTPTKRQLQKLIDEVGEKISDLLDPVLTREELVAQVQELDALVNGTGEEDEDDHDAFEDEDEDETAE